MNEVVIRTTRTFTDTDGGFDYINGGEYDIGAPFDPEEWAICASTTDVAESDIREFYCRTIGWHQFVILHNYSPRLQFCEIQVNNHLCKTLSLL